MEDVAGRSVAEAQFGSVAMEREQGPLQILFASFEVFLFPFQGEGEILECFVEGKGGVR